MSFNSHQAENKLASSRSDAGDSVDFTCPIIIPEKLVHVQVEPTLALVCLEVTVIQDLASRQAF